MDDGGKAAVSIMEQVSIMELNSNITALDFNPDSHTWYETTAWFSQNISGKMKKKTIMLEQEMSLKMKLERLI